MTRHIRLKWQLSDSESDKMTPAEVVTAALLLLFSAWILFMLVVIVFLVISMG